VRVKKILLAFLVVALLSACGGSEPTEIPPPTVVPTHTPEPPPTMIPTASSPLALLVIPEEMEKASADLYQKTVYDLAQGAGFRFQVRNSLTAEDIADPTLKVVVALPPDPGIASLAAAAPNVQFLAVNIPDIAAGGNVSVLAPNTQSDISAFLAGYTLAMLITEYHIGMLIPQGDADAQRAFMAFNNGVKYYCGLCAGIYYSQFTYPTYLEIPVGEDPARFGGYASILINERKAEALYIYPTLANEDFLAYIGTQGVLQVGTIMPKQRPGGWVMTISPDIVKAIQTSWPQLIAGQGGQNIQSPLGIADVDTGLLTQGKLRLVQEALDALLAGRILTTNP
jgi:hypothetical protein